MTRPCEVCGAAIAPERLEVLPETRLCPTHAQMIEKFGGEFVRTASQASLGKEGSLKKNYGDISVSKKRNYLAVERLKAEVADGAA